MTMRSLGCVRCLLGDPATVVTTCHGSSLKSLSRSVLCVMSIRHIVLPRFPLEPMESEDFAIRRARSGDVVAHEHCF